MAELLKVSENGSVTLPADLLRRLGVDRLEAPVLIGEMIDGKLVLEAGSALAARDIPIAEIRGWIAEDETAKRLFEG